MDNVEVLDNIDICKLKISQSQYLSKEKIIYAGDDNLSFNKMAELFNQSQTVICSVDLYKSALIGDIDVPDWLECAIEDYFKFSGFYLMISRNLDSEITNIKYIPYETCRLTNPDDSGKFNTIAVCDWAQRVLGKKTKATLYPIFDIPLETAFKEFRHTISIYYFFKATPSYYPISRFSAVLQDCAVEGLLQEDRYNALINGSAEKIILRTEIPSSPIAKQQLLEKVNEWVRPSGSRLLLCNTNFTQGGDGLVDDFKVDVVPDNRNLLDGQFETRVSMNISKAAKIPFQLIQTANETAFSGKTVEQSMRLLLFNTTKDRKMFTKILNGFGYDIALESPIVPQLENNN